MFISFAVHRVLFFFKLSFSLLSFHCIGLLLWPLLSSFHYSFSITFCLSHTSNKPLHSSVSTLAKFSRIFSTRLPQVRPESWHKLLSLIQLPMKWFRLWNQPAIKTSTTSCDCIMCAERMLMVSSKLYITDHSNWDGLFLGIAWKKEKIASNFCRFFCSHNS